MTTEHETDTSRLVLRDNRNAGAPAFDLSPEMIRAGEAIFEDWLDDNADLICSMGGRGKIHALLAALWASWKNAE